jgi:Permuted papain-like amidase enzyme, YaeF/YiiX, C92 family
MVLCVLKETWGYNMSQLLLLVTVLMMTAFGLAETSGEVYGKKGNGPVCLDAQKYIAEGDVVFTSNHNYLFRRVERDTLTWTSHVGVAFKNDLEEWVIYESTWPKSKITPLCEFMQRSYEDRVEIKRFSTDLAASQIRIMKMAATRQLDLSYDQGFDYEDDKKSFCSKFVYKTYQAVSIEMGSLHTFQQVFDENPDIDLSFWKTWFFGRIPYERVTISPAQQIRDGKFRSVFQFGISQED